LEGRPIQLDVSQDLPLVHVDGPLIEQALVNLLENAARHTPSGTPLEIRARLNGPNAELWVIDHGPGIPEQEATQIFEKFHQSDPDREGFGLGLAIARAILRIHSGEADLLQT